MQVYEELIQQALRQVLCLVFYLHSSIIWLFFWMEH